MKWCFWVRWELNSHLDNSQTLPLRLQRHLSRCACCNAYFQKLQKIDYLLRCKSSDALSYTQHQHLQRKILAKMPGAFWRPKPIRSRRTFGWLVGSAVAASILLSAAVFNSSLPCDMKDFPAFSAESTAGLGLSFAEWEIMMQNPFQHEIQNLDRDLLGAVAFLSDCMPVDVEQIVR